MIAYYNYLFVLFNTQVLNLDKGAEWTQQEIRRWNDSYSPSTHQTDWQAERENTSYQEWTLDELPCGVLKCKLRLFYKG